MCGAETNECCWLSAEPSPSAKHCVGALVLKGIKGRMFGKLYHGRSCVKGTPKNTLEKYCTFLPITMRDGSTSVPSCLVLLLKFSSSFFHPVVSHVLSSTAPEVSQTL